MSKRGMALQPGDVVEVDGKPCTLVAFQGTIGHYVEWTAEDPDGPRDVSFNMFNQVVIRQEGCTLTS